MESLRDQWNAFPETHLYESCGSSAISTSEGYFTSPIICGSFSQADSFHEGNVPTWSPLSIYATVMTATPPSNEHSDLRLGLSNPAYAELPPPSKQPTWPDSGTYYPAVNDDRYLDSGSDESTPYTFGSPSGSAPDATAEPTVTLSHTFTATDPDQKRPPADTALITRDLTVFYVDEATLITVSDNGFGGVLPLTQKNRVVQLSEITSYELHVVLQAVYNPVLDDFIWKSPICHSTLQIVVQGIDLMPHYGINPRTCIKQYSHLFEYLLTCSPIYPVDVYALAAYHDMEDIAIAASSHMLMIDPSIIDATTVSRIGPSYFRRLNDLHQTRKSILTQLLMTEPALHNLTKRCTSQDQQALRDGWNRGVAKIMKEMKAGTPTSLIRQQILEETTDIHCKDCVKARNSRLDAVCTEWSITSRTI